MNVKSVEKKEHSIVELVIEVGHDEFESAIEKVYRKQRGKISVPGFRKGKAPRKIIEGMYGSAVFYEDAINEIYPEAYATAVDQEKLDVVAWPDVEIKEVGKDGFTFLAKVTVRPEVKLGEYKGLTAEKDEVSVSDEDVDNELKPYIARATRMVTVEREAKNGDTAVIDFEGFKDGVPFEGGKAEKYSLELGSGSFIPGFEDQVAGMKAGEEKDVNVTFPEDYGAKDLAGAPVVFKVKVHEVQEKQVPVLDDEFAKDVSEFDTLEAFKKDLADKVKARKETSAENMFKNALIQQVVENMEVEIPDAMVDYEADKLVNNYAQRVTSQGMPFEQYLAMMGMTMEQMKEQAKEQALHQVQSDLALGAIVEAEKIEISDEDVDAAIKRLAEQYGMTEEQVKSALNIEDLKKDLAREKAANTVFDSAKVGKSAEEKPKRTRKTTKKAAEKAEEKTEE
ncbi:MAG: trigger factor [Clostridiales bacterium]|nr:trigger factor [Clostridiales bacterium]MDY4180679.1 trigger factor [Pseudoflavonifractor sp.]